MSRCTSAYSGQRDSSAAADSSPDPVAPDRAFRVELQNVGKDPRLCREIGNEIYCY